VFRVSGVLVALSTRADETRGRRNASSGSLARAEERPAMNFLYAAYAATWTIHIVYLITVVRRYSRLKKEVNELNKKI
jgi:CcmD family protein